MSKLLFFILVFQVLFYACSNTKNEEKVEIRQQTIKYKDGNVYCIGAYAFSVVDKEVLNRVGVWNFYYSDGNVETILEYDENGDIINQKSYLEDGSLVLSESRIENITTTLYYYENGTIQHEVVSKDDYEKDKNYEVTTETNNEYYRNGKLMTKYTTVDSEIQGVKSIWDTSGNLILTLKYKDGVILE